ncbi:MAG TPA: TlpA disulfide reductase family protein [Capsulimonadaceae bacterium]|jgi:peroxiredoxin/outer membrane lipoprotein-sorting protein
MYREITIHSNAAILGTLGQLLSRHPGKRIVVASLLTALVGGSGLPANAADTGAGPAALLRRAATTLQAASSVTAEFEELDSYPGQYKDLAQRGTVLLSRTGKLRVDIKRFRRVSASDPWAASGNDAISVSDGNTYKYVFLHPSSTQVKEEVPTPTNTASALGVVAPLRDFYGSGGESLLAADGSKVESADPVTWEGLSYRAVKVSRTDDAGRTISSLVYIGSDNLVHRVVQTTVSERGTSAKEWILRNIVLNTAIEPSRFAYTPPPNATPLVRGQGHGALSPGETAPDFTVTNAAGAPITLSSYRGKTVVLDFWATWCWPCNQSLPHTMKVVEGAADKDVVVLAVAIWDSKVGFDTWLTKHSYPRISFAIDTAPQGQDIASRLYHVSTTPTAFVIDKNGAIVRSIPGYSGPTDQLANALNDAAKVVVGRQ